MRLIFFLLLAVCIMFLVALFPEVAQRELRVEAFGWVFNAKQGSFMIALFLLLCVVWAVRRMLRWMFGMPGRFGGWCRLGGQRQQASRLRTLLANMINEQQESIPKWLKKRQNIMPEWMAQLLRQWLQPMDVNEQDDALHIALAARQATHPDSTMNLLGRKKLMAAWLNVYPKSPLAKQRQCELLKEEGDWLRLIHVLEERWKKEKPSAIHVKSQLTDAYVQYLLALDLTSDEALAVARKAQKLDAKMVASTKILGQVHLARSEQDAAAKIWFKYLEKNNCFEISQLLYNVLAEDALKAYRKLEKKNADDLNAASQWLRAKLAHAAELDGLAEEHLQALLEMCPCALSWRTRADWYAQKRMWQKSTEAYQKALGYKENHHELAVCS